MSILEALVLISAVLSCACVVAYQVTQRGNWHQSEDGWHVMSFMGVIASVLVIWSIDILRYEIFGTPGGNTFRLIQTIDFALVPAVIGWRLLLIMTANMRARANVLRRLQTEEDEDEGIREGEHRGKHD